LDLLGTCLTAYITSDAIVDVSQVGSTMRTIGKHFAMHHIVSRARAGSYATQGGRAHGARRYLTLDPRTMDPHETGSSADAVKLLLPRSGT